MAERRVNLENLVVEKFPHLMGYKRWDTFENYLGNNKYIYIQDIYDLMKEVCKQVLELAAENVVIELLNHDRYCIRTDTSIEIEPNENSEEFNFGGLIKVDKQSILNTINQIE